MVESERYMDKSLLLADIEAAEEATRNAEDELRVLINDLPAAPRAAKIKVSEVVKDASSKLNDARTRLIRLQKALVTLEESENSAKLTAARSRIEQAEAQLEKSLAEMQVEPGSDKVWVTTTVHDALTSLRAAKGTLADLESEAEDTDVPTARKP